MTQIEDRFDHHAPDAELVEAALDRDQRAFTELVCRYEALVKSIAYAITGDLVEKEEIAQEAFLVAWRQLPELKRPERFRSWLCGIVQNLARKWQRDELFRFRKRIGGRVEGQLAAEPSPLEHAITREEELSLERALAATPEQYRVPLVLFYTEQRSVEDIADVLRISEVNAKTRLSRGRRLLQASLLEATLPKVRLRRKAFCTAVVAAIGAGHPQATRAASAGRGTALKHLLVPALSVAFLTVASLLVVREAGTLSGMSRPPGAGERPAVNREKAALPAILPGRPLADLPRPPGESGARSAASEVLGFDFEDGSLPPAFDQGHVVPAPPGSASRFCVMGTLRIRWPKPYVVYIRNPDDEPLFTFSEATVLSFDHWVADDPKSGDTLAITVINDRQVMADVFLHEYVRGTWGHAEVPLVAFVRQARRSPRLREGDPIRAFGFEGGHAGGQPLYIDNIKLIARAIETPDSR